MSAFSQRDQALAVFDSNLAKLSELYGECYPSKGRGALLVYASDPIEGAMPTEIDYRTEEEILEVFDASSSHAKLAQMIDTYDPKAEGIMTLITSYSNATFFVTFKLEQLYA